MAIDYQYEETRGCMLKIEGVEGTDAVPVAGTDGFQLLNSRFGIEAGELERNLDTGTLQNKPMVPIGRYGVIDGDFELIGANVQGATPPIGKLLRIGGFGESLVVGPPALARFNLVTAGVPSASVYGHHGNIRKKLLGSRAKLSGLKLGIDMFPIGKAQIMGNCIDADEIAMPAIDYTAFIEPEPVVTESFTLTVNGVAVGGVECEIDAGTDLKVVSHSEARIARIQRRRPTIKIKFWKETFAALNPYTIWNAKTRIPIVATQITAGQTKKSVKFNCATVQMAKPQEVPHEGDIAYEWTGRCLPSASGLTDDVIIELGS